MAGQQKPPRDLKRGGRGRRLWKAVTVALSLDEHEVSLLHEACRCLDRLDILDELTRAGAVLKDGRMAPWLIESRQQQLVFSRLIASLRLPEDLSAPEVRPQRRGGSRGIHAFRVMRRDT